MTDAFWNEKFLQNPNLYGEQPNAFLKSELKHRKPGKLLLPGEGEGRNALHAAAVGWDVFALDQSTIAKQHTLEKAQKLGLSLRYETCDITHFIPEPETFDVVALIYFHLPPAISTNVYHKLVKALKPGGEIIIEGFGKRQLSYTSGGPKNIDMLYAMEELKASFPSLEWSHQFDGIIHLEEGEGHRGDAHVIRLVGTKKIA